MSRPQDAVFDEPRLELLIGLEAITATFDAAVDISGKPIGHIERVTTLSKPGAKIGHNQYL